MTKLYVLVGTMSVSADIPISPLEQMSYPSRVVCAGKGLSFGYVNRPMKAVIDTRKAGPGELVVYCDGPGKAAHCQVSAVEEGVYQLDVTSQEAGEHTLHVEYSGQDVTGSPFFLKVSPASLVKAYGSGLRSGILKKHNSEFILDTQIAGPGELNVQIGGPQGTFNLKTKKKDRRMICKYAPKDYGIYIIRVLWSGDHVPGSPFHIYLAKNQDDLINYQLSLSDA